MDFVAVKGMLDVVLSRSLKRDAILFDRLAIPNLHLLTRNDAPNTNLTVELEYLSEKGIVFEPSIQISPFPQENAPDPDVMGEEYRRCLKAEEYWFEEMMNSDRPRMPYIDYTNPEEGDEIVRNLQATLALQYHTRRVAAYLREVERVDAHPVYCESLPHRYERGPLADVVQITLNSVPGPKETTPWEQILEFREDSDSRHKFLALRNWMSQVGKGQLTHTEISQQIEYLLSEYSRHIDYHKIKTTPGILRTLVLRSAEAAENIVKLNFGKVASNIFFLHETRMALMEAEATAPGRELAYLYKARREL